MKLNQNQALKLVQFISAFFINGVLFLISIFFTEITITLAILYSLINALWMTFIFFPILLKISERIDRKKIRYELSPLIEYVQKFEKRQAEIRNEVQELEERERQLLTRYKFDWKLYRKFLRRNKINYLYHFTDKSNLESILESGGLFSWKYCIENNIFINKPGGDDLSRHLDKKSGLEDYIRLSFTPNHPMMYFALNEGRLSDPVILKIDIEAIYWLESKYSDTNATSRNSKIGDDFNAFSRINFKVIQKESYFDSPEDKKKYTQAEVLVKEHIPIKYINNIYDFKEL